MAGTPYALALTAGMVAAVNPCGFALLPGYVSLVVVDRPRSAGDRAGHAGAGHPGEDDAAGVGGRWRAPLRAVGMTAAMTGGFVTVFGLFGLLVTPLALSVGRWLPWVTIVVGAGLIGLGGAMAAGREVTAPLPKPRAARVDGTIASTALYGASYALASLSCAAGPFLAVTTSAFSSASLLAGIGVFGAYAAGMGLVVGVVTALAAFARDGALRRLRRAQAYAGRAGGALLVAAGCYVTYYGVYEIRVRGGAGAA
ncbi:cytochrome c biogenesis CcdA family protein, partial [Frankia nepalensis]